MDVLYARYSDLLSGDTITVPSGTEDLAYPRTNITDRVSHTVGKFTGTSGTFRRTFGVAQAVAAVVFVNTNATAIQLTNNAGLSVAVSIPTTPEDGHPLDPWIDLRGLANTSATQWNAALTGPTGVGLGEFVLIASVRSLLALWQPEPSERESHPVSHAETDYDVDLDYGMGVRVRGGTITAGDVDGRAAFLSLERDQRGRLRPFVLIPNSAKNDALFAKLASDVMEIISVAGSPTDATAFVSTVAIAVKEQQKGLAL
jgi:hypothetical protein